MKGSATAMIAAPLYYSGGRSNPVRVGTVAEINRGIAALAQAGLPRIGRNPYAACGESSTS